MNTALRLLLLLFITGCAELAEQPKLDLYNHDFSGRYYGETHKDTLVYILDIYMDSNRKTGQISGDAVFLVTKQNRKLLYGDHTEISVGYIWERVNISLRLKSLYSKNQYTYNAKILSDSTTLSGTFFKYPEYWQVDVDITVTKVH